MTMTDAELDGFRASLLAMLEDLSAQESNAGSSRDTVTLDQQAVGRLSRMDALQQQAMANATHARRQATEARIRAALGRIDEGEFGYCVECGDDIPRKRLQLDPTVLACVSCATG